MRLAGAGLAALLLAVALFASQQGGDGNGPLNAIAAAAERTQEEPGARATIRTTVSRPDLSEPFTIGGAAVFNDETERSRAVMRFRDPESGEPMEMRMVTEGLVMYMSSEMFEPLPGDKEWMKIDLSFGGDPELPFPSGGDPQEELQLLQEAIGARKLGKEEVRGVPTTRYRGMVNASENAEHLREQGLDDLAAAAEEDETPLTVEVWIDADSLIRRMRYLRSPDEGDEKPETVDMRIDFFDFGISPEIGVPEESEVFDATPMLEAELEKAGED